MTFYSFLDKHKEQFKNKTWTQKRDAYVKYMKKESPDE